MITMTSRIVLWLAVLTAGRAQAAIVDGDWVFHLTHHDSDEECRLTLATGAASGESTEVTFSAAGLCGAFGGTLDTATGTFSLSEVPDRHCSISGTFAADGLSVSGDTSCLFGGAGYVLGARCTTEPCDYASCADPNPCLIGSYYLDGECVGGRPPLEAPIEAACDDGNPCTGADRCDRGSCHGVPDPICQPPTCDCGPCRTCRIDGACAPAMRSDCATAPVDAARVNLHTEPSRASWRLRARGVSSSRVLAPPGAPELCVFDARGGIVAALSASPHCRKQSCWRPTHLGARYDDPGAIDALTAVRSWRRRDGRLLLYARGQVAAFGAFPPSFPLRVELRSAAACWATTFATSLRAGRRAVRARSQR